MSSWINDAAAVQNHNGAAFLNDPNMGANMLDPSAFMGAPSNFVDPSQFQNPQLQQRMQNGGIRNPSPAFNNPVYQTNPVVPSKRPRPREDSLGTSPRQPPGMLPNSRSQTPQQAGYPGFQGNVNQPPQHPSQPTPYAHLQHNGSSNASPSPVMGNQLRPGAVPQRVSTASPHPFSPAVQQFGSQNSPSQSDHGSRVETPQNPYLQNAGFGPGFNQNFTPPPGRGSAGPPGPMGNPQISQPQMPQPQLYPQQGQQQQQPPNLEQQKMMYQMRLQAQLQQSNLMNAQRMQNMPQTPNAMAKPPMQAANGQFPAGLRPQQPIPRPNNPEQFMKNLTTFMQARGLSLDMNPIVGDRAINLVVLYMAVTKYGGYRRVNAQNLWPQVAAALQFNPMQNQSAPQQIKGHYERNLMMFEEAYTTQQRQKAMMQQTAASNMGAPNPQMSPTKQSSVPNQINQQNQFLQRPQQQHMVQQPPQAMSQHAQNTPVKQVAQIASGQQPAINGFSTPQASGQHPSNSQGHNRNSLSRGVDATPSQNGSAFPGPSPASAGKATSVPIVAQHADPSLLDPGRNVEPFEIGPVYDPRVRTISTWGGINCGPLTELCAELVINKPNVPSVMELGVMDIHALTMSLQSGIHAEVRLALDTLVTISVESRLQLDLKSCEDLVETIIDCAESQLDLLAENSPEVSDVMLLTSYEDVVRGCRAEREGLQDTPAFGSLEYELDRSVERLICITTIIRNLSFYETNHPLLADELVIKFLCVVIRYLGTRNMLLRSYGNTLDFMKDVIIFLSNLAQTVEIPGREQALCLLNFLLAFAPSPPPNVPGSNRVIFSPYDPSIHRYLPPAVDSLAKLLARDEPNRTLYKGIFASDVTSSPPYDLLTKSFALAISPIPGQRGNIMQVVEARKPHLMQGMLAAEILSNLAPGHETSLARSWLSSEDGFAQSLLRLITVLANEVPPPLPTRGAPVPARGPDDEALLHITLSGINILRRLFEKSRNLDDPASIIPTEGMIKQENLLGALLLKPPAQPKAVVIKQLCAYAELDK